MFERAQLLFLSLQSPYFLMFAAAILSVLSERRSLCEPYMAAMIILRMLNITCHAVIYLNRFLGTYTSHTFFILASMTQFWKLICRIASPTLALGYIVPVNIVYRIILVIANLFLAHILGRITQAIVMHEPLSSIFALGGEALLALGVSFIALMIMV